MFDELDTVELTHDIKEHDLKEGHSGAVVNVYSGGKAYEVEFVASNGRTIAVLTLTPDDIRLISSKEEYLLHGFGFTSPIYVSNASEITSTIGAENVLRGFDAIFDIDKMRVKEKSGSKVSMEEFYFSTATL